jgi:hypothetical protein
MLFGFRIENGTFSASCLAVPQDEIEGSVALATEGKGTVGNEITTEAKANVACTWQAAWLKPHPFKTRPE